MFDGGSPRGEKYRIPLRALFAPLPTHHHNHKHCSQRPLESDASLMITFHAKSQSIDGEKLF